MGRYDDGENRMEGEQFDNLARALSGPGTRRQALRFLAGGALGALFARLGLEATATACLAAGKGGSGGQCCSGFCGPRETCCLVKGKRCKRGSQC